MKKLWISASLLSLSCLVACQPGTPVSDTRALRPSPAASASSPAASAGPKVVVLPSAQAGSAQSAAPSGTPSGAPASSQPVASQPVAGVSATGELEVSLAKGQYLGEPQVGLDAQGNFIVSWLRRESADKVNLYARRYQANGAAQGEAILIQEDVITLSTYERQHQNHLYQNLPRLAVAADGEFALVYGRQGGLYFRIYGLDDKPVSEAKQLAVLSEDGEAALAALPGGNWVSAWRGDDTRVRVQRISRDAKPLAAADMPFSTLHYNRIAVASDGKFLVVSDGQAQRYDQRGQRMGAAFALDGSRFSLGLGLADSGQLVVTQDLFSPEQHVLARRYGDDDKPLGDSFKVTDTTLSFQGLPETLALMGTQGDFSVIWGESRPNIGSGQILLRRYDASGKALEGELQLNSLSDGFSARPAAAMNQAGKAVVVWQNWNDNQGEYRIMARMLDLKQAPQPVPKSTPAPVDCSKAALEKLAPVSTLSPELEKLKAEVLARPAYTGPIDIKLRAGSETLDPRKPGALNGLAASSPYLSQVTINGKINLSFQTAHLIATPRKSGCFSDFLALYGAESTDQIANAFLIKLTLSKAPVERIEDLLRGFGKNMTEDLSAIEFSSLEAMQTFLIYLDMVINQGHYLNSLEFNMALSPG